MLEEKTLHVMQLAFLITAGALFVVGLFFWMNAPVLTGISIAAGVCLFLAQVTTTIQYGIHQPNKTLFGLPLWGVHLFIVVFFATMFIKGILRMD